MATRKDATLERYEAGGYCLRLPDGSEYEADTQAEAFSFAREEGCTRIYSTAKPDLYVILTREDK